MGSVREIERLRVDARFAYLDGRNKRAKALNRKADLLARAVRNVKAPA